MFLKLLGLLVVGLAAQSATITATSSQTSYPVGASVRLDLTVSGVADLYAFQLDVLFDPAILAARSVDEAGYFLSNGVSFSPGSIDNTAGSIRFIADAVRGSSSAVAGSTTLATLTFSAIGAGTTNIIPANIILLDSHLADISVSGADLPIHVLGTNSVPEGRSYQLISIGLLALILRLLLLQKRCPEDSKRALTSDAKALGNKGEYHSALIVT